MKSPFLETAVKSQYLFKYLIYKDNWRNVYKGLPIGSSLQIQTFFNVAV